MSASHEHLDAFAGIFGEPPAGFAVPVDWAAVETWLGTRLPGDYKTIAAAYGPLDIGEWLWLHMPCAHRGWFDYGNWVEQTRRAAPGVLPFGATRTADTLFWDTTASDDPDQWPVVMHCQDDENAGRDPWRRFRTPLVPTLARLVADGLRPVVARSALLTDLEPTAWTPPPRRPEPTARQRSALTEGSGLEALTALVPPPESPALGKHGWEWLHERLGTRLPGAYVRLMEQYGAGTWAGWLRFHTPLGDDQYALAPWAEWYSDTYRSHRADFPQYHPLAVWPEPGGFLPFADSIDGDQLCWLTEGATPDDWRLIVVPRHADQGPPLESDLTETLLEWLRGRFTTEGLPWLGRSDECPLDYIGFEPFSGE
ncbi:SMI1/KNR4 family protein [Streptomyces sp. TRM66268-LWL]|uniref:SMI1/KNR4 family protein n=1 Tax=Streptomyces polyasparticus TaxID=2767826 RepID=A0ABR7SNJ4_9ACTN|nr:SMI1/KNR4 family protein [Streptomyces polyasparticus]MBC9716142.1 SMI1/KNR4 family protein [Streptomyces polyasparticus]